MVYHQRQIAYRIVAETVTDIIYITDNSADEAILTTCRKYLEKSSKGKRIISISQQPLDFGENICVGNIGRSVLSLETQIMEGLKKSNAEWIAIAEHDCIYSSEHFDFIPPDDRVFWYNRNVWVLRTDRRLFYYRNRRVNSQLICKKDLLEKATQDKLNIFSHPSWNQEKGIGEPGVADYYRTIKKCRDEELNSLVLRYAIDYSSQQFWVKTPNVDIKHDKNFSGRRLGKRATDSLHPWGRIEDILCDYQS